MMVLLVDKLLLMKGKANGFLVEFLRKRFSSQIGIIDSTSFQKRAHTQKLLVSIVHTSNFKLRISKNFELLGSCQTSDRAQK